MSRSLFAAIALVAIFGLCLGEMEFDTRPLILVDINTKDTVDVVVGKNATVQITVRNIGQSDAFNLAIEAKPWVGHAKLVSGELTATLETLKAGASHVHTFVYNFDTLGAVRAGEVSVKYAHSAKDDADQVVFANTLYEDEYEVEGEYKGILRVLTQSDFDKRNSKHIKEWVVYVLLLVIFVGGPALMFFENKRKFDSLLSGESDAPARDRSASPQERSKSPVDAKKRGRSAGKE